jgi:tocopherol O-methyltransferase
LQAAEGLSKDAKAAEDEAGDAATTLGAGSVRFVELDAEKMGEYFGEGPHQASFDCVWISEAMSHLPDKALFFRNAYKLLKPGGRLVVADWFKREVVTEEDMVQDIRPIEGMFSDLLWKN